MQAGYSNASRGRLVGFSGKIKDPAFQKYLRNANRWSAISAIILAAVVIGGFTVVGEKDFLEIENPKAFFIGLSIGGMILFIAFFQILGRKRGKTWDGVVVDKTVKRRKRKHSYGSQESDVYWVDYTEYVVVIRSDDGKKRRLVAEDNDTIYNYYQIGDRVRHHAGLNTYEKYDKSRDKIIFCNACATLCKIEVDACPRCGCPLLK